MTPTTQQLDFLRALTTSGSHLALRARAGCGKTSTFIPGGHVSQLSPRRSVTRWEASRNPSTG